jgi:hypothetical protein
MRKAAVPLCAVVLAAACASPSAEPSEGSPTPEVSVTSSGEYPEDLTVPSAPPSRSRPAQPTELTGVVTAGVEPGCLLLDGYLLVGGDPTVVRTGARVRVTGRVESDLLTTCQQGTPFRVSAAAPA